jgi:hypothetical protein
MNKRILAAGNGDQLTEVTPNGVLLVWKWNPINKQYNRPVYTAHNGDWSGQDAINARSGAVVLLPTVDELRGAIEYDAEAAELADMEATYAASCNRLGY